LFPQLRSGRFVLVIFIVYNLNKNFSHSPYFFVQQPALSSTDLLILIWQDRKYSRTGVEHCQLKVANPFPTSARALFGLAQL